MDGVDGLNGKDGIDGIHADPQTVFDHIKAQPKGKRLKIEHVDELQVTLDNLGRRISANQGGFKMRGGGDTVAAGTGITISKNSNGVSTISSTGGGGFTTLTATEVPNGTLTVFTFSTATAQPTFIVSDGTFQPAVAKSGTTNWTWNAGAKQATMTVPPQNDIIGIK